MSTNLIQDMYVMHSRYKFHEPVNNMSKEDLYEFLKFRFRFLNEELAEGWDAVDNRDPEEIVDALVDLVVIAIGTLDLFKVNAYSAWDEVLRANLNKKRGVKESRPNPFGLPDLIKPEGWVGPDHTGNHGLLTKIVE